MSDAIRWLYSMCREYRIKAHYGCGLYNPKYAAAYEELKRLASEAIRYGAIEVAI